MNTVERATRFALSGAFVLIAVLLDFIAKDVKFDIAIYDRVDRVDNYAQFVGLTWIFVAMALIAFIWALEAIFTRKEKQIEETFDVSNFSDTW